MRGGGPAKRRRVAQIANRSLSSYPPISLLISCCFLIRFGDVLIPSPVDPFWITVKVMGPLLFVYSSVIFDVARFVLDPYSRAGRAS